MLAARRSLAAAFLAAIALRSAYPPELILKGVRLGMSILRSHVTQKNFSKYRLQLLGSNKQKVFVRVSFTSPSYHEAINSNSLG